MRKIPLQIQEGGCYLRNVIRTLTPREVGGGSMITARWFATVIELVVGLLVVIVSPDLSEARPLGETGGRNHGSRIAASVTGNHTCAIKEDGTVRCWGSNSSGQLGNNSGGTGQFSATPVQVSNLTDAVALAAGTSHSCALKATGGVVCWGSNGSGRLGDGTTTTRFTPVAVLNPDGTQLSGVVGITAGLTHTCAVRVDGTARCWGSNASGKLGNGNSSVTSSAFALAVTNLADAVSVAAGNNHTCAVRVNGLVTCWGSNSFGQRGNGSTDNSAHATPADVPSADLNEVVAVAAGSNHTCAARASGLVRCWGSNLFGQIGDGTTVSPRPSPTAVDNLGGVAVLALGADHSCARRSDGDIRCWGRNDSRQLGDGTTTNRPSQVTVADRFTGTPATGFTPTPVFNAEGLAVGERHSCSLQVDDKILCWGANDLGQLGNTNTPSFPNVVALVSGSGGTIGGRSISAGVDQTCARRADGSAACWGSNLTPSAVTGFTRTLAVATGLSHKCALRSDGLVHCVGSNQQGQIGNGAGGPGAPDVTDPAQGVVSSLTDAAAIAAGNAFTCALRVTGFVRCWGDNAFGQLGNDFNGSFQPVAVPVQGLTDVVALAAGRQHACAVRVGGTVQCWGNNAFGQVGASAQNSLVGTPFPVSGITNAVGIAAGPDHSCALLVNGRAKCWGKNDVGQLGNNEVSGIPSTPHPTPDDVENLTDAVALAAGGSLGPGTSLSRDFTCARRAGGTVRCWGDNAFGQLGDNSTTDHLQPETSVVKRTVTPIPGGGTITVFSALAGVSAITAGNLFGCALLAGGQPFCWGSGSLFALPVSSFTFNIDPDVTLIGHNRVARVTVLANCPEGQQVHVEVQLTQGGVFGQGHTVGECTGGLEEYLVTVAARGRTGFEPGPAEVQADAVIRDQGRALDTQEWTRRVNLAFEP